MLSEIGDIGEDLRTYTPIIGENLAPKKVSLEGTRPLARCKQNPNQRSAL